MSEHVEDLNRKQTALFPETLEEYVDEENPVRFIDAFVDSLNLEKLGFKHSVPTEVGRPSYDPGDLLKQDRCVFLLWVFHGEVYVE
jgi:transposase